MGDRTDCEVEDGMGVNHKVWPHLHQPILCHLAPTTDSIDEATDYPEAVEVLRDSLVEPHVQPRRLDEFLGPIRYTEHVHRIVAWVVEHLLGDVG